MSENQQVEWKESWRDEYLKWICGFANAQGGVLEIGRDNHGQAVGLTDAARLMEDLPNKMRDTLGIIADVDLFEEDGKALIRITVEPYPYPISYRGQYHYRSGSTRQELKGAALDRFLLGRTGKRWDSVIESYPMPESALREALLNAVIHRDDAVAAPIQIRVYGDRLLIWNPGELPEGWSMEKLLGRHPSHPYNPDIANTFFWSGDIEAWGCGIQRIQAACRAAITPEPRIEVESRDVWIEFPFSEDYLASISGGTSTVSGGTTQKTTQKKTPERLLEVLRKDPVASRRIISERLTDITQDGVKYHLDKLKKAGRIRRVGPDRGGYWEILEDSDE
jgi:predicted HTH transcriptional regulator